MTPNYFQNFHDFSMTFQKKNFFKDFSRLHDCGNPAQDFPQTEIAC